MHSTKKKETGAAFDAFRLICEIFIQICVECDLILCLRSFSCATFFRFRSPSRSRPDRTIFQSFHSIVGATTLRSGFSHNTINAITYTCMWPYGSWRKTKNISFSAAERHPFHTTHADDFIDRNLPSRWESVSTASRSIFPFSIERLMRQSMRQPKSCRCGWHWFELTVRSHTLILATFDTMFYLLLLFRRSAPFNSWKPIESDE